MHALLNAARRGAWTLLGLALASSTLAAPQAVAVPSLDAERGTAVVLPGHWFAATAPGGAGTGAGTAAAPALVLMHGCGGLFNGKGALAERYTELAARLNAQGVHALVLDSFTPRGEKQICTQRTGQRRITQLNRRRDALGALQWLAAQPGVDAARLGLLGWSNGGSTVLAATNRRHAEVAAAPVQPSLAVAFYPGCESELQRGYEASAPLLMLLGEADDWTPAAPCKALASGKPRIELEAYAGAYHGFDGNTPVRLRTDVPNGTRPGAGVHVGAEPAARAAAAQRLHDFLRQHWALDR